MSARWLGSSELTKRLRRMRVQSLKVIYYAVVVSDSSVTSYTVSRERFVLVAFSRMIARTYVATEHFLRLAFDESSHLLA